MRIALVRRRLEPTSLRVYREQIARRLEAKGITLVPFRAGGPIPSDCDIVWDPGLSMAPPVVAIPRAGALPVVATFHGMYPLTPFYDPREEWILNRVYFAWVKARWEIMRARLRERLSALIVPSHYAREEAARILDLPPEMIHVIHHGVDLRLFRPDGERIIRERPYFLHVARLNPMKNSERVLQAYSRLPESERPDLVLISPGDWYIPRVRGVTIIRRPLAQEEMARWYRGALGLVAPSLRESFLLALLEAMACGCPVITSNRTGCPEAVEDAALLVAPESVEEIAEAMRRLSADGDVRQRLRERGVLRARRFSWDRSAEAHMQVFRTLL